MRNSCSQSRIAPQLATVVIGLVMLATSAHSAAPPAPPAAPAVTVDVAADQGHVNPSLIANIGYEGAIGMTIAADSDPAFQWLRQSGVVRYVRLANWMGDGYLKRRPELASGAEVYSGSQKNPYRWADIDAALDTLVASGLKPILVCGGVPDAFAAGDLVRNDQGALANAPADLTEYRLLITRAVKHFERRYGQTEVRTWYLEAWSNPDEATSWAGSPEQFYQLYDHLAAAVFAADSKLRVGGPGVGDDLEFLRGFLQHCVSGENAVTGKRGTKLDFISRRQYGSALANAQRQDRMAAMLSDDFPELKETELIVTEWGVRREQGAAAPDVSEPAEIVSALLANLDSPRPVSLIVRQGDLFDDHFNGQRALISRLDGRTIPSQSFRIFEMLSRMGDQRLQVEAPHGWLVLATRSSRRPGGNAVQILLCRTNALASDRVALHIRGLGQTLLRLPVRTYQVDDRRYNAYGQWVAAGRPVPAPQELADRLLGEGLLTPTVRDLGQPVRQGTLELELTLPAGGVALVTVGSELRPEPRISRRGQRVRNAETAYLSAAEWHFKGEFRKAVTAYREVARRFSDTHWATAALKTLAELYEVDLKSPREAEAVRLDLLHRPLNRQDRLTVYRRLLIDAVRRNDQKAQSDLQRRVSELVTVLQRARTWASGPATSPPTVEGE